MLISFTGVDDRTDLSAFYRMAVRAGVEKNTYVEAGVLIYPEKQGEGRNPSYATRTAVRESMPTAAHLCGKFVFRAILQNTSNFYTGLANLLKEELPKYPRIQVNINARSNDFTPHEVWTVYRRLMQIAPNARIILQYHERSAETIMQFFAKMEANDWKQEAGDFIMDMLFGVNKNWEERFQILVDSSRGKGISPESWAIPKEHLEIFNAKKLPIGMAGNLKPNNIVAELQRFIQDNGQAPSWMDMESGVRSEVRHPEGDFNPNLCELVVINISEYLKD